MDDDIQQMINNAVKENVEASRRTLLQEIGTLFDKISDHNNSTQLSHITNLVSAEQPTFKKKSNEEQFKLNSRVIIKLKDASNNLEKQNLTETKSNVTEAIDILSYRQKLIQMADSSELGWRVVKEYESNPIAEDSEDEKKIYKAEARASRKLKAERANKKRRSGPYRRDTSSRTSIEGHPGTVSGQKPGLCFQCGKAGHWRKECPGNTSNNKISIISSSSYRDVYVNAHCRRAHNIVSGNKKIVESGSENQELISQSISPVGRLKAHADKWRSETDSTYIVDVVENGYKLPFKDCPESVHLKNNKSARDNPLFVTGEIGSLLEKGVITVVNELPLVVNPLTVAYNKAGKPRLVLDCRHINQYIHVFKIKFEDIRVAQSIFKAGVFAFTYDLKGAYHHIDIAESHRTYLGFSWNYHGKQMYFVFNSLPFGLSSAGHIFTKVVRIVVTYLRSLGHKVVMFLDDGIGGHPIYEEALRSSNSVKEAFCEFGFLIAEEKCQWLPVKVVTWLGYVLDFSQSKVFITEERIGVIEKALDSLLHQVCMEQYSIVKVRVLASLVGRLISLQYVLGNVVRMRTRDMYNCIISRASWDAPVLVTDAAIQEMVFWKENVRKLNCFGRLLDGNETCQVRVYCDASAVGYGGYLEFIAKGAQSDLSPDVDRVFSGNCTLVPPELGNVSLELGTTSVKKMTSVGSSPEVGVSQIVKDSNSCENVRTDCSYEVTGSWLPEEQGKSSSWREAEAVYRVIRSKADLLRNQSVKVFSDNKNVKSILQNGSRKSEIQAIALNVNNVCEKNNICLLPEWIPREMNELSDYLSRCHDCDDWSISDSWFNYLDSVWGKHTVDRFSSHMNNHCERFNSRWWVPGTEGINAFNQSWQKENNWLVPPPRLITECLSKIENERASCTLVVPKWKSAPFWPCLLCNGVCFKGYIKEVKQLPTSGIICIGKGNNGVSPRFHCRL